MNLVVVVVVVVVVAITAIGTDATATTVITLILDLCPLEVIMIDRDDPEGACFHKPTRGGSNSMSTAFTLRVVVRALRPRKY